jgi:2-amino-4-hydroxy-6-hydroxymethyldihydropteridine diphosphokinase
MGGVKPVAIALGSNLGDRRAHLDWAVDRLRSHVAHLRVSTRIETDPVEVDGPQPRYVNAAAVGETSLGPDELLQALLAIERERGRERPSRRAPRTLDLDLILFGDLVSHAPHLTLPHPRFRARRFVLEPLAELVPDWTDPVTGRTMADLLSDLGR